MKIKIYSGLSLNEKAVKKILPTADFSKPIIRGDILKDIQNGYHIIGIIDGEFFQNLALSPTEVLDAIRCGVVVFGSSSMGALRAAELKDYGMIGAGSVYEFICNSSYFKDDFLGQLFYENTQIVSLPYIDFYFMCNELALNKKISSKIKNTLLTNYEKLHFTERNLNSLATMLKTKIKQPSELLHAIELLKKNKCPTKKNDALLLLQTIKKHIKEIEKFNNTNS